MRSLIGMLVRPFWLLWRALEGRLLPRRVPVILQMNMVECGAACLAMILKYHGRDTTIADCREACGGGRDGITALSITQAARHFGLQVKAYSVELATLPTLPCPAIVHWNFNHFLVVERWRKDGVDVVDPAVGRCRLSLEEFDAGFTGVILTFEPGLNFQPQRRPRHGAWRTYVAYLYKTPGIFRLLGQVLIASVLLQVIGISVPLFTKFVVDHIIALSVTEMMRMVALGLVIIVLLQGLTTYLRASFLIYLQARLDARLMIGFFEHVLSLPFAFFQKRASGDLLLRLGSNTVIRDMLTSQVISSVLDASLVTGYLIMLFVIAPQFAGVVLFIGLLQIALMVATTPQMHNLMRRELEAQASSQSYLVEVLKGMAALKASGSEDQVMDHWTPLFFRQLNTSLERNHLSVVVDSSLSSLRLFSPLFLLWIGAWLVLNGEMTLGTMLALNSLAASFLRPLASLVASGQQFQLVGAHLERIADVIEAPPEQWADEVMTPPRLKGAIDLQNVSFRYSLDGPLVLRDISLSIAPGQKVALVGQTGSGKSTLGLLLLGLYQPTSGEILYDGIPIKTLNYRLLRNQVGVVLQSPTLFNGSIRQSISFNNPAMNHYDVMGAARLAAIHEEIMSLPMGYETLIAEGGSALSGGQRQRVALARALARRPALLLLDEATSHLDMCTEQQVDHNLSQLVSTRIVIAHRLSTIRNADQILVLHEGQIVERGTHDELIAQHGHYRALVQGQTETSSEPLEAMLANPELWPALLGGNGVSPEQLK